MSASFHNLNLITLKLMKQTYAEGCIFFSEVIFKFWLRGFGVCECVSGLFVMCRVQTCLVSLSEIRDRLAWGRLALAQLRPQTGSGMSLQYSLPLCGLTTLCSEKVLTMRQTCYALSHRRWAAKATLMVASHLHLASSAAFFFFSRKAKTVSCT